MTRFEKRSRPIEEINRRPWPKRLLRLGALALGMVVFLAGCDATGSEPTVPPAPSGLEAASGNGQVTLIWSAVEEANEYNVYRSTSPIEEVSGEPVESVLEPGFVDESVENGTTYYYRVTAAADEEGEASGEVEVTPFADPPDRP